MIVSATAMIILIFIGHIAGGIVLEIAIVGAWVAGGMLD